MQTTAKSIEAYLEEIPKIEKIVLQNLENIQENIPNGFVEQMSYGWLCSATFHYPNGYHCEPKLPLPFITIAFKNFIALTM
jgi:hypothetical protein